MPRASSSNLRRTVFAAFYGIVTLVLLGGVIGFAQASDEPPQGVPKTFTLPAPKPGDSATYRPFAIAPDGAITESSVAVKVHHGAPQRVLDREGRAVLARPVTQETLQVGNGDGPGRAPIVTRDTLWRTSDAEAVSHDHYFGFDDGFQSDDAFPISSTSNRNVTAAAETRLYRDHENPLCLAEMALQGVTADLASPVALWEGCTWPSAAFGFAPFEAIAKQTIEGIEAIVFREMNARRALVWLSETCPFPVQVAGVNLDPDRFSDSADLMSTDEATWVLRIVSCPRGAAAAPIPTIESDPRHAPPVRYVPRDRFGPQDDLAMEFSLADAWELAFERSESGVKNFVQDHPDFYLAAASYGESNGGRNEEWHIVVTDGTEALSVWVGRVEKTESYMPRVGLGIQPVERTWDISVGSASSAQAFPRPVGLPASAPSPSSLAARAAHMHGGALDEPAWGFRINCDLNDCDRPKVDVWAGTLRHLEESDRDPSDLQLGSNSSTRMNIFQWSDPATTGLFPGLVSSVTWGIQYHDEYHLLGGAAPRADERDVQAAAAPNWVFPEARWAVGAGFAAILVAILYWLWPNVKVGALALFSRIERPAVLEQRARRGIMTLIDANPGIYVEEVIRRTGYGNGTVNHHIRKLVETGLVTVTGDGYRCLFVKGTLDAEVARAVPLLKGKTARRLVEAVSASPCTQKELSIRLGITAPSCHYFVQRLSNVGLLSVVDRDGRRLILATPKASQALAVAV